MSQQPFNQNDKRGPGNRPPQPGDDPNNPRKGPKFSIYWIYAIIFAFLIGFQLFGSPFKADMAETDMQQFGAMLLAGDVDHYVNIENKKRVKIYLKKESIKKYEEVIKKGGGKVTPEGPHLSRELRLLGPSELTRTEAVMEMKPETEFRQVFINGTRLGDETLYGIEQQSGGGMRDAANRYLRG